MSLTPADSIEILALAAKADGYATARDADGYAELFTEDAMMDGDQGTVRGRQALRTAVARVWANEPSGTLHLTLNAVIDDTGHDPAVDSLLLLLTPGASTSPEGWRIRLRTIKLMVPA
jgi:ketosteroid isomerase-like protein